MTWMAISGVGKVGEKVSKVPMILIPHSFSIYENLDFCICATVKSGKRATDIHVSSNCAALSSMNHSNTAIKLFNIRVIIKRLGHTINQSGLNSLFSMALKRCKSDFSKDCPLT